MAIKWKVICLLGLAAMGCQTMPPAGHPEESRAPQVKDEGRAVPAQALLHLDQIEPAVTLPAAPPAPTTQPAVEAVLLFARAHDALLQNHGYMAIGLLERTIKLDPHSYDLYYELGQANLSVGHSNDRAVDAFEQAAKIRPDSLSVHLQLARLYLLRGDVDKAVTHLRIAKLTKEYKAHDDAAVVTDLLLARALQQKGYVQAALDEYELVMMNLKYPTSVMRGNPELAFLIDHPEVVAGQMGQLYEQIGEYDQAMSCYQTVAQADEGDFDDQAQIVRLLLKMNEPKKAAELSAKLVRQFRASPDSMDLLRQVYQQIGTRNGVIQELARLHEDQPADRAILFTLADTLHDQGKPKQAEQLLAEAARQQGYEPDLVQRLNKMYEQGGQTAQAAQLLIEALAHRPDSLRELAPMMSQLLRPTRSDRLTLRQMQELEVPPDARAAKAFWISRVADLWNRGELARDQLRMAADTQQPFAPAYRLLVEQAWARQDWTDSEKQQFSDRLETRAGQRGDSALASELHGLSLLHQNQATQAVKAFEQAEKDGSSSPDLKIEYASALLQSGQSSQAVQTLWKLITDYPTLDDGYDALFRYYLSQHQPDDAMRVLRTWLTDAPMSVSAKLVQAMVLFQSQHWDAADQAIGALVSAHPENAEVLNTAAVIFHQTGRLDQFVQDLQRLRQQDPRNQVVVEQLVDIYGRQNKTTDAERVLNQTHAAVGNDPDLLYYLAHLYSSIGRQDQAEAVLEQVLKIDPDHSGAANDLGYTWADHGEHLARAEELIRRAVKAEPDNESFLDSLGWVQYKRGEFEAALKSLKLAVANTDAPDPVVLNHLGDTYYRLGQMAEAKKVWAEALDRLGQVPVDRDDLRQLRTDLPAKINAAKDGGKIEVAPIAAKLNQAATQK